MIDKDDLYKWFLTNFKKQDSVAMRGFFDQHWEGIAAEYIQWVTTMADSGKVKL